MRGRSPTRASDSATRSATSARDQIRLGLGQRLADGRADRQPRIQRAVRVLEDGLHRAPVARQAPREPACECRGRGRTRRLPSGAPGDRTSRAVVVLPHPLSPTRPSVSPRRRTKSTPSTAFTVPNVRPRIMPRDSGKCLVSPRASRTTSPSSPARRRRRRRDRARGNAAARADAGLRRRAGTRRGDRARRARASGRASLAARLGHRAARGEAAARRHVGEIRRLALDRGQRLAPATERRQAVQEADGVGVARAVEDVAGRPGLDDPPGVHHRDPVAQLGHDAEVVGDEDERQVRLALDVLQEAQVLGLDRHVERGRRLVGDRAGSAGRRWRWRRPRAGGCRRSSGADRRARGARGR